MPASDGADTRDIVTVASPCCNAPMTPLATAGPISVAAHFAAAWRRLRIVRRRIDRYRCVVFAALFIGIAVSAGAQPAPEVSSGWIDHAPVRAQHWMIAAANPLAVDAGYAMLARGGSAVDAVIAAQLVLGLVEPQSSGIGGGAFMLVHDAAHRTLAAYDGRETAPAAAQPDRFIGRDGKPLPFHDAVVGGRSVGVPGVPRLLQLAHRRHGKLPWASLFAPAIALAENGFAVSPRLHALIASERYFLQPRIRA